MHVLLCEYVFVMAAFRFSKAAAGSGFGLISVIISRCLRVRIAEEDPPPKNSIRWTFAGQNGTVADISVRNFGFILSVSLYCSTMLLLSPTLYNLNN